MKQLQLVKAEKNNYISRLGLAVSADKDSQVEMIRYAPKETAEYAEIKFLYGHTVAVDITGDSCAEIYKAVGLAVYGI